MNLKDARELRDKIRPMLPCVVPLGFGPDGYFARARLNGVGPEAMRHGGDFHSWEEFQTWRKAAKNEYR